MSCSLPLADTWLCKCASCTSRDRSVTLHSQVRRVVVRSAEWKSRVSETSFSSCHPRRQFYRRCLPSSQHVSYLLSLSMMVICGAFSSLILVFVLPSTPSCCQLRVVTTGAIRRWDNSAVWKWSSLVLRWCWRWRLIFSLKMVAVTVTDKVRTLSSTFHSVGLYGAVWPNSLPRFDNSARGTTVAFIFTSLLFFTQLSPL